MKSSELEYPCTNCKKKKIDYYGYIGYCLNCDEIKKYEEQRRTNDTKEDKNGLA